MKLNDKQKVIVALMWSIVMFGFGFAFGWLIRQKVMFDNLFRNRNIKRCWKKFGITNCNRCPKDRCPYWAGKVK